MLTTAPPVSSMMRPFSQASALPVSSVKGFLLSAGMDSCMQRRNAMMATREVLTDAVRNA